LDAIVELHKPDVICVTEFAPKKSLTAVQDSELQLEGFDHFSNINCFKRGVVIYVSQRLRANPVDSNTEFDESVWVEITLKGTDKLLIGCIYRSPNSTENNNLKLTEGLRKMCEMKHSHLLLCGDFNLPEIDWSSETTNTSDNHIAYRFLESIRDCYLSQHVTQPTHHRGDQKANTLDLLFSNEEDMITDLTYGAPIGASHHSSLHFKFRCYAEIRRNARPSFAFNKGNYEEMKNIISRLDWKELLEDKDCAEAWEMFHCCMKEAMTKCIPRKSSKPCKTNKALWMNEEALAKVKKKSAAYKRYLETKEGKEYIEYARARNQARWACRKMKKEFEKKIAQDSKTNPKTFYKYVNSKLKTRTGIADLDTEDGKATTDTQKAEALNSFFTSVFTREALDSLPTPEPMEDVTPLVDIKITEDRVEKKLKKLNPNKSSGPDEMHPKMLYELSSVIKTPLTIIMQKSLEEGILPRSWKDAHVSPIFKKGKKCKTNNYRPVSLTSVVCKMFESIVRDHIMDHIQKHNILTKFQHGFAPGRSCSTQLVACLETWTDILDRNSNLDSIYLDFSKAFDCVPHERLCMKMENYGIKGKVLAWLKDFLHNRRQKVVVCGEESRWEDVLSGVPQGSVIGPTLFIIFINDMPECVQSFINMFADDAKLYAEVAEEHQHSVLQQDLERLQSWAKKWQMVFNAQKCKVMHIGNSNAKYNYHMGEVTLSKTSCEKDLGVWVDDGLKFSEHINNQVIKANKILGLIRRSFSNIDSHSFKLMYKSLIRTHLEYANVVCYPQFEKDAKLLENVQRRATKLVPSIRELDYESRMKALKLPSLKYRRERGDMIEAYKYTHGLYDVHPSPLPLDHNTATRGHIFKLEKKRSSKTIKQKFFTRRVVNEWNTLPETVVEAPSLNSFKSRLDKHWSDRMYVTPKLTN